MTWRVSGAFIAVCSGSARAASFTRSRSSTWATWSSRSMDIAWLDVDIMRWPRCWRSFLKGKCSPLNWWNLSRPSVGGRKEGDSCWCHDNVLRLMSVMFHLVVQTLSRDFVAVLPVIMQTVCRLTGGNQRFRCPCCNGVHRHDQPAVWRLEVCVWSPAGDRQGNAAAPLERPGHCRAAGESVMPVWAASQSCTSLRLCVGICSLQPSAFEEKAIEKVDDLLESYMGIRDSELGTCVDLPRRHKRFVSAGCAFVCLLCSLTSVPVLSGHHGWAGKRQKEPRWARRGLRWDPGRLRLPWWVCFRRVGRHRWCQGRAGVTADINGVKDPVSFLTNSTTRKHYRLV